MKKTFLAIALLLMCGSALAQNFNVNLGGIQWTSGATIPTACTDGSWFYKNVAPKGWIQCNGGVFNGASSPVVNTANQGFLWLPTIGIPANQIAGAIIGASNNQVQYLMIVIPYTITVNKITVQLTTASASVSQVADFGIYSADGTTKLLATNAGVTVSTGTATTGYSVAASPLGVVLTPGPYIFAWTSQDNAVQFECNPSSVLPTITGVQATKKYGIAGNSATNGILPTALGTLTTVSASRNIPFAILEP